MNSFLEGSKFKPLNFPDPFNYGDEYKPIFPPRHPTMKAILDKIPSAVSKVYVFGNALRLDATVNSDLDVFIVGEVSSADLNRLYRTIPEGEIADIVVESEAEFLDNLNDNYYHCTCKS